LAVQIDAGEDLAEVGDGTERPALVVQAVDRLMDGGRDVTGPADRIQPPGGPEALAPVLIPAAHVDDDVTVRADGVSHRHVVGPERPVRFG
jgi:hypothetical protein